MKKSDIDYDITKIMIETVKRDNRMLNEEHDSDDENKAIPITNEPKFGQNVLQNQIDALKKAVSGGAKFADENSEDAESNPLVYYPKTGNLVFTGSIPSMSKLRFQFSLNDVTNAPYIFVDGLALTDDVINIIQKLNGYYKNWREEWEASDDLLSKLSKEN